MPVTDQVLKAAGTATDPMPGSTAKLSALMTEELAKWHNLMQIAKLEPQ